ncbi:pyrroloquinoline quinone biosynthesis protein PqqF [Mixta tenebrionis]|uniref:Coenzyme PQQ synthesis protein F n=1 Tax=Mixta tenebrionis TaxID=2562439 RepID=A0A506VAH5_9GAMM|nr:pyrroloquinoline quinone biosynthesis protein PqqF [Mixta tenebrionis]TPW41993.1 pyrroloquinoline quinone biosynthesis protein PqqF [Mixta tenebrionis]
MSQAASLRLENGLRIELRCDVQASEAAALIQVASGSDDEPARWPGLAHLLEHMLFTGSRGFRGAQRLMSWVPAQGGRLNATTHADRTAFFFTLAPAASGAGLARLVDMLAFPLLTVGALAQEAAVIDAEYQLLRTDALTLSGAAQRHLFSGPPALHRFHVGDRASFGEDLPALLRALRQFHQQRYHAGNMTLWLLGPQPLNELETLARRYGAALPMAQPQPDNEPAMLQPRGDAAVNISGAPQLRLTFALNRWQENATGHCALLRTLLRDEAEGGLLAHLRAHAGCDGAQLELCWRGGGAALLSVSFDMSQANPPPTALAETALRQWLQQLQALSAAQLTHYLQLARQHVEALSPLDRLREAAFGFAPPQRVDIHRWQAFLTQLCRAAVSRLWLADNVTGEPQTSAGFSFICAPFPSSLPTAQPPLALRFWPFPAASTPVPLPDTAAPLSYFADAAPAVLTLRPRPETPVSDALGGAIQAALRALAASLAHQGGQLSAEQRQGVWQLQLSGEPALMQTALAAVSSRLAALPQQKIVPPERGEIAIRRLLRQLPRWLTATQPLCNDLQQSVWQAALTGGDRAQQQALARLLSQMPMRIAQGESWLRFDALAGCEYRLTSVQGDSALLLFCPLAQPDLEAQLAWRLLAQILQPLFFQRLRMEQQVGYVASCSFHQTADRTGVLFALQSPQLKAAALRQHIERFLTQSERDIAGLSAQELAQSRERLWQQLQPQGDVLARARQRLAFSPLTTPLAQQALRRLDNDALLAWHRRLSDATGWQLCIAEAD